MKTDRRYTYIAVLRDINSENTLIHHFNITYCIYTCMPHCQVRHAPLFFHLVYGEKIISNLICIKQKALKYEIIMQFLTNTYWF